MLIFGWRRSWSTLAMITLLCGHCRNPSAHALRRLSTMFTIFFIPLIPLGSKTYLQCTWCGAQVQVPAHDVNNLLAQAHAQSMRPGGPMQPRPAVPDTHWPQQP